MALKTLFCVKESKRLYDLHLSNEKVGYFLLCLQTEDGFFSLDLDKGAKNFAESHLKRNVSIWYFVTNIVLTYYEKKLFQ